MKSTIIKHISGFRANLERKKKKKKSVKFLQTPGLEK